MALPDFAVTIHVFSARGARLGVWERTGSVSRQMPFNGTQTVSVSIPRPLATEVMCRFGNLCIIESASGVELWGGVIRGRRTWSLEGPSLTITSFETFLNDLLTPQLMSLRGMSPGQMVKRLLTDALSRMHVPIAVGLVADAGQTIAEREFHGETLLSVVQSLSEGGSAYDWWCEATWSASQDSPRGVFHLVPSAGRRTNALIAEGHNAMNIEKSDDDSAAVTIATVVANGNAPWGERPTVIETDGRLAQALSWPRQAVAVRSELTGIEDARAAARAMLRGVQESLVVGIGNAHNEWATIRNGDWVRVDLPSFDFQQMNAAFREPQWWRVVGRTVDESQGIQQLQLTRG